MGGCPQVLGGSNRHTAGEIKQSTVSPRVLLAVLWKVDICFETDRQLHRPHSRGGNVNRLGVGELRLGRLPKALLYRRHGILTTAAAAPAPRPLSQRPHLRWRLPSQISL